MSAPLAAQDLYDWSDRAPGSNHYLLADIHAVFECVYDGNANPSGKRLLPMAALTEIAEGPSCCIKWLVRDFLLAMPSAQMGRKEPQ